MVTTDMVLVVGQRRFTSAKELGWKNIDARVISVDEVAFKLLEIDENLQRKNFSWQEEDLAVKRKLELLAAKHGTFSPAARPRTERGTFAQLNQPSAQFAQMDKNSSDLENEHKLSYLADEPNALAKGRIRPASVCNLADTLNASRRTVDRQIKRAEFFERYPVLREFQEKSTVEELGKLRESGELSDEQLSDVVTLVKHERFPVPLAESFVKLEEEKRSDIIELWKTGKINAPALAKMINDSLAAKAKELYESGKPQVDIGRELGKSQSTVSRILNEKTWLLNTAGAILALIGSGGSIDGARIAPYALESLLRDGILKDGPVHGRYVFTDEALDLVGRSSGVEGSAGWYAFIHFLTFKLARFDMIKDDNKFQEYLAHIAEARKSRKVPALDYSESE